MTKGKEIHHWFELAERPDGSGVSSGRVICIPGVGGYPELFHGWLAGYPAGVDFLLARLPGAYADRPGESLPESLQALAARQAAVLAPMLDRPYAVFGHSMGGIAAFELVRTLIAAGAPAPRRLVVAGSRSPLQPRLVPAVHDQPADVFWDAMGADQDQMPPRAVLDAMESRLRADLRLIELYQPGDTEPLPCPLTVFGGRDDAEVAVEDLARWEPLAGAGCSVTVVPGGHGFPFDPGPAATIRMVLLKSLR